MKCILCNIELDKVFYHYENRWSYEVEDTYDNKYSLYRCPICGLIYGVNCN